MNRMKIRFGLALVALGAAVSIGSAQKAEARVFVGIGLPGVYAPAPYYAPPPPVYYPPPPVYYAPPPPAVVYPYGGYGGYGGYGYHGYYHHWRRW